LQELEAQGVNPARIACKMAQLLNSQTPALVLKAVESYLRLIGAYAGPEKGIKIGKLAQIINLPTNDRQ
jgi:hypothetical protein